MHLAASVDRFPGRWRYFSRPYKYPDESFRRALHPQKTLALVNREIDQEAGEEPALAAAERALQSRGYNPERVLHRDQLGIFAERHRISELAVFIVHSSLLLIFFGTIVDGLWGWRGTLNLNKGQSSNIVEMRDGKTRTLPFSIRCDRRAGRTTRTALQEAVVQTGGSEDGAGCRKKGDRGERSASLQRRPHLPVERRRGGHSTGLEVSHEPGQWGVWSGVVLMGVGLASCSTWCTCGSGWYRFATPRPASCRCGSAEARTATGSFEERFNDLVASIEEELKPTAGPLPREQLATVVERLKRVTEPANWRM